MLRPCSPRLGRLLQRRVSSAISIPGVRRNLDEIAKRELFETETRARIGAIWETYHADKPGVAGTQLKVDSAEALIRRAVESPTFVFPIRREGGHFMLLSQYSQPDRMFVLTFLAEYQRSPASAQPWASVHIFDDLLTSKGIALLRVEVSTERLTKAEASHLLLLYERYYCTSNYDKVYIFNHSLKHFNLDKFLETCP